MSWPSSNRSSNSLAFIGFRGVQLKDLLEYPQRIRRRTRRELEAMRPQRTTRTDTSTAYGDSLKLCRWQQYFADLHI